MPSEMPLIATKLYPPPAREALVPRPQLFDRLDQGLRPGHKLISIAAPAGFGKSTLLGAWLTSRSEHAGLRGAWVSLDPEDNDPARFWTYCVTALQRRQPGVGDALLPPLRELHLPALPAILAELVNTLAELPGPLLLALDDYHVITNPAIHESLAFLLEHLPPQLHLALTTRVDPPLPLARLRARGQLTELRSAELRFTVTEAAAFLNESMDLGLTGEDVAALAARTEGWITGLQLAALSLRPQVERHEFVVAFSGSHRYVVDYLMDEVLARQPEAVRCFLRRTSILERLSAPLCDALFQNEDDIPPAEALLETLERDNLFLIPLDGERRWYRYHQLFADFQRRCLRAEEAQLIPELHLRAGRWFAAQEAGMGHLDAAIRHLLAAEAYAEVVALLERQGRRALLQGHVSRVAGWFDALPESWRISSLASNVMFAWALLLRGQYGRALGYLEHAERALEQPAETPHPTFSVGEVRALQAIRAALQGEADHARRLATEAIALAEEGDLAARGLARFSLASAYNHAGDTDRAVAAYEAALPLCRTAGMTASVLLAAANLVVLALRQGRLRYAAQVCAREVEALGEGAAHLPALGSLYSAQGMLHYERNDLETAHALLTRGLRLSRLGGHYAAVATTLAHLARWHAARGELEAAQERLDEAEALLRHGAPPWVAATVLARRVELRLARGEVGAASGALAQATGALSRLEAVQLTRIRLAYHEGSYDEAARRSGTLLAAAEARGEAGTALHCRLWRALSRAALGELAPAFDDLIAALSWAEPEGYLRTFVDLGPPLAALLEQLRDAPEAPAAYVDELLRALGSLSPAGARRRILGEPVLPEPLSERELEVLQLMAQGLTYREIGEHLFVSVNTVRYHVKNLYGKLGVGKRAQAVARARELKLL